MAHLVTELPMLAALLLIALVGKASWRRHRRRQWYGTVVISDTTAISNLAAIDRLDILEAMLGDVVIPVAVWRELRQGAGKSARRRRRAIRRSARWIHREPVWNVVRVWLLQRRNRRLDRGEAEAIILAKELRVRLIIIDEQIGRKAATKAGLAVTGVLGIILDAKHAGIITHVRPILDALRDVGFYMSDKLYFQLIAQARE